MEEYKDIIGYEGLYKISNLANVKSFKLNKIDGRILKLSLRGDYSMVRLYKDNKPKTHSIHRLVGQAFIENPNDYNCIDHINQNKLDNRLENLRWITKSGNCRNKTIRKSNKSGYRGVCWNKQQQKWWARINIDKKEVFLGCYDNPEEASKIYEEKYNELMEKFEK